MVHRGKTKALQKKEWRGGGGDGKRTGKDNLGMLGGTDFKGKVESKGTRTISISLKNNVCGIF